MRKVISGHSSFVSITGVSSSTTGVASSVGCSGCSVTCATSLTAEPLSDEGDAFTILGQDNGWVKVAVTDEKVGYVASDYVYVIIINISISIAGRNQ